MAEQEHSIFFAPQQQITLLDPPKTEWTLDIGGGGEGTMARWIGPKVVAIDMSERELAEAPAGPLKMVGDGSDTPFLEGSFDLVTMFFVMMYVAPEKREKIWREAWRVLKPGGRVLMWGLRIPPYDGVHDVYAFHLNIGHPKGEIETGYGTRWEGYEQDPDTHLGWARDAGFAIRRHESSDVIFHIEAIKGESA